MSPSDPANNDPAKQADNDPAKQADNDPANSETAKRIENFNRRSREASQRARNRNLNRSTRRKPPNLVKRSSRRNNRRRGGTNNLVIISWRDIPAQVNGGSGATRVQRILPLRFQQAIDRAAVVANKTQASQYVAEWRRTVVPCNPNDSENSAIAAAAKLEEAFPLERLNQFVKTGGWNPDQPESQDSSTASTSNAGNPERI